jgi:hypothetical protein
MSPRLDRKSRRALFWMISFAVLTVLVAALALLQWMQAPTNLTVEVVLTMPAGGGELYVGGKAMGGTTIRLENDDLYALCEETDPSAAWPPPGGTSLGSRSMSKVRMRDCLVPPIVAGGEYVWHCDICDIHSAGTSKRFSLRFRAADAAGNPLELASNSSQVSSEVFETRATQAFGFGPSTR